MAQARAHTDAVARQAQDVLAALPEGDAKAALHALGDRGRHAGRLNTGSSASTRCGIDRASAAAAMHRTAATSQAQW